MVIGIDATNISFGGGFTHLKEILNYDPRPMGFSSIVVFGSDKLLEDIPCRPWIIKHASKYLNKSIFCRLYWIYFKFRKELKKINCDILFNPGGGYIGNFHPYVTMFQNMLVFEEKERARYKYSKTYWRLLILSKVQAVSFKKSDGIIFISDYARKYLISKIKLQHSNTSFIPHGVSDQFYVERKNISYAIDQKNFYFKILYVSIVDLYKHQWVLVSAINKIKLKQNIHLKVEFVGPFYKKALKKLNNAIAQTGLQNSVNYLGKIPHHDLHKLYSTADIFVFLSTCENMPIILLEAMRSRLPILCSNKNSMKEFLKDGGWYCNPEDVDSVVESLETIINSPLERENKANIAYEYSRNYNWENCSLDTYNFLKSTLIKSKCVE